MVACSADGSFYQWYDLSIYCHDGFFYKSAYKIGRVFAYPEIITSSNQISYIWLSTLFAGSR